MDEQRNGSETDAPDDLRKALSATDRRLRRTMRMLANRADPGARKSKRSSREAKARSSATPSSSGSPGSAHRAPVQGSGDRSELTTRGVVRAKRRVE
jgi:hypothetical protein